MIFEISRQIMNGDIDAIVNSSFAQAFVGGLLGFLFALGIFAIFLFGVGLYVYHSLAWMTIARKLKYKKPWFAWIPFVSTAMRLQLGGFHWAWTFLWLIPIIGWVTILVLLVISHWKIFEKRKYPGWFGLSIIIPQLGTVLYLVIIGFVAWDDRKKMLFK
jgi:hypothetical protein